jgi:hypothetical protein
VTELVRPTHLLALTDSEKIDWLFWWNIAPVLGVLLAIALLFLLWATVRICMGVHRAVRRSQGWQK